MAAVKVTVVEDELPIQRMYKTKLELAGFTVSVAGNGYDGLRIIKQEMPDIVLLDLRMPGMPGDEMLARLREKEWGANMRVIILTNVSRDEAPPRLRYLGVSRYVVKAHYTPAQVVSLVHDVLGTPHSKR